jgi:hypothetical protein
MTGIVRPSQSQQEVVGQGQATLDRVLQRSIIRRTSIAGLIGLVYGLCAGVILAAYQDFGSLPLLEPPRLMMADPKQVKLLPGERMLEDAAASPELMPQVASAAAVADAGPIALPIGHIRPAMAPWSAAEPVNRVAATPPAERGGSTRGTANPDPSGDEPTPVERSVAAAPEPHPGTAVAMPKPAFKPLDAVTTMMAEAVPPAALGAPRATPDAVSRSRPARPSLQPVVATSARPEPAWQRDARATAAAQTLPKARRSFWTNLKIFLASAPARSEFRLDRDRNGGGGSSAGSSGGGGSPGSGGGGSSPGGSGGGGSSPGGSGGGGGSPGSSGGGGSPGGSNPGGSDGGTSGSGGGTSGSGGGGSPGGSGATSASSGDDGSSASSGNSDRGRGDRGRGGRGDRDGDDDGDDRGDRDNDRGDRGNDRGDRGNGRGGDDDD